MSSRRDQSTKNYRHCANFLSRMARTVLEPSILQSETSRAEPNRTNFWYWYQLYIYTDSLTHSLTYSALTPLTPLTPQIVETPSKATTTTTTTTTTKRTSLCLFLFGPCIYRQSGTLEPSILKSEPSRAEPNRRNLWYWYQLYIYWHTDSLTHSLTPQIVETPSKSTITTKRTSLCLFGPCIYRQSGNEATFWFWWGAFWSKMAQQW